MKIPYTHIHRKVIYIIQNLLHDQSSHRATPSPFGIGVVGNQIQWDGGEEGDGGGGAGGGAGGGTQR
jgi:hypothetical protein